MLKVAVIGMGPIGNKHARAYRLLDFVQLVGVCDIREDRAKAASAAYGVPCFLDATEMIKAVQPDLCSVCTGGFEYSSDHYKAAMDALRGGCHVLCEKPLSNRIDCATEMVQTAKELGLCLGVDFNHRFSPASYQAKKWIDDGRVGDKLFCNMALWIGKFGQFESEVYHLKALEPHAVNMMEFFMDKVKTVTCFATRAPGRNIYSTASINMQFENGGVGHLTSSYDLARAHPMERLEVAGTKGRVVFEDMWRQATLYPAETMVKEVYTNPVFGGYRDFDDTFNERIRCFAKQVNDGCKPEDIDGSGEEGLSAVRIIHSAIQSLYSGGAPVNVAQVTRNE